MNTQPFLGALLLGLGAATLPLATPSPAHAAAAFAVDRTDDPDLVLTAMACTDAPDDCSLRAAIVAANTTTGADVIIVPAGRYTLSRAGAFEDAASTGDLDITDDVTITGAGARSTIVAGGPAPYDDRVLETQPGVTAAIAGLTITGGKPAADSGGSVRNYGDLTLDRVAVKGNRVLDGYVGGGIYSEGPLHVTNSTMSGNSAGLYAGGLAVYDSIATIANSTISGNRAGQFAGGLLAVQAVLNVRNSTVTSNKSGGVGGGIKSVVGATVVVRNSIVAGNSIRNCHDTFAGFDGTIFSQGNNVADDSSCGFTEPTDTQRVNPRLGPLGNNGGPTDTRVPLAGSPALDHGPNRCPAVDQRGVARPQGLRCDSGALERRNRRPVVRADVYRGREDTTLRIPTRGVLHNDRDPDGDSLRARVVRRPAKGRLTMNANGSFSFRPPRNFHGTVRFRYRASDEYGGQTAATVTIRIAARQG